MIPGDSFTVTVTASANAPESQNVPITITGTPSAATAAATTQFTLDVTPKPGSLPGNRTDFVSTGGTPYGIVYDRQLDLIFASNPTWNRIDVISNKTHLLERSIPIRVPTALDLSQDGSTLWIGTNSRQIFALNTTTFGLTRYLAPVIASGIKFLNGRQHAAGPGRRHVIDKRIARGRSGSLWQRHLEPSDQPGNRTL